METLQMLVEEHWLPLSLWMTMMLIGILALQVIMGKIIALIKGFLWIYKNVFFESEMLKI